MGQDNGAGDVRLANGAGLMQPQHQQQRVNPLRLDIQLLRQRGDDGLAKTVEQRVLLGEKVVEAADPLLTQARGGTSRAVHQVVAQGVDAVAVKLNVELLLQAVELLAHLLRGQEQHRRVRGVAVIENEPVKKPFDRLPHAFAGLFPIRVAAHPLLIERQHLALGVVDHAPGGIPGAQEPHQAGLRLNDQVFIRCQRLARGRDGRSDLLRQMLNAHHQLFAAPLLGPRRRHCVLHGVLQLANVAPVDKVVQDLHQAGS